jgi:hypothetical protein
MHILRIERGVIGAVQVQITSRSSLAVFSSSSAFSVEAQLRVHSKETDRRRTQWGAICARSIRHGRTPQRRQRSSRPQRLTRVEPASIDFNVCSCARRTTNELDKHHDQNDTPPCGSRSDITALCQRERRPPSLRKSRSASVGARAAARSYAAAASVRRPNRRSRSARVAWNGW